MSDRVVEIREDIKSQLEKDGVSFEERIIDFMVQDFGEEIDNYEMENDKELVRGSKKYTSLMLKAIRKVTKRVGKIDFRLAQRDCVEDDYSEESNADYKFRR